MDGKALSMDLRERAISRVEAGGSVRAVAASLSISPSCVVKWSQRWPGVCPEATSAFACRASSQKSLTPRSNTLDAALMKTPQFSPTPNTRLRLTGDRIRSGTCCHPKGTLLPALICRH